MSSSGVHFEVEGVAPEVELGLIALASALGNLGIPATLDSGRSPARDSIVIASSAKPAFFDQAWRVEDEIREGRLRFTRGDALLEVPWSIPAMTHSRRHPPLVLIRGGSESRRIRMATRTNEELARRKSTIHMGVWGGISSGGAPQRGFSELHLEPGAVELGRLLLSAAAVFEAADEQDDFTPLPWMALAAGVPRVLSAAHPLAGGEGVADWSPESFADAVERAVTHRAGQRLTLEQDAARVAEAFGLEL